MMFQIVYWLLLNLKPKKKVIYAIFHFSYCILAELRLASLESNVPNFPCILLLLSVSGNSISAGVDIPSVLLLKNLIKKHWAVYQICYSFSFVSFRILIQPFLHLSVEILLSVIYFRNFQMQIIMFAINSVK